MSDPIENLKNLITGTSVSLAPVVAWIVYALDAWEGRREKWDEARQHLRQVMNDLVFIGHWAQTEYPAAGAPSPTWREPLWSVNDFPSDHIHEFNRVAYRMPVPEGLRSAMASLETAIEHFRGLLRSHRDFVWRDEGRQAMAAARDRGAVPPAWFDELFRLNRDIHVRGIGTAADQDGLHSTWKRARDEVQRVIDNPGRVPYPKSLWLGHVPALILASIGLWFLVGFICEIFYSLSWPPWPR
ncbi:MAG TPA: hypothetical protein VEW47_07130 [Candidatus Dormibacteraeota bacterium]|nr:hypothetical protein [Candidatus Dormibacteraeota bacterium]